MVPTVQTGETGLTFWCERHTGSSNILNFANKNLVGLNSIINNNTILKIDFLNIFPLTGVLTVLFLADFASVSKTAQLSRILLREN